MSDKKHIVRISEEQRTFLERVSGYGKHHELRRAQILILSAAQPFGYGKTDAAIADLLSVPESFVLSTRTYAAKHGIETAVFHRTRRIKPARVDSAPDEWADLSDEAIDSAPNLDFIERFIASLHVVDEDLPVTLPSPDT